MDTNMPNDLQFNKYYQKHLKCLQLNGLQPKTVEAYSRAIRRIGNYFDCPIDDLSSDLLLDYFNELLTLHSWSTVKLDLYGLPKGLRRTRCYGFLHPCGKKLIKLLQVILRINPFKMLKQIKKRPKSICPVCKSPMEIIRTGIPKPPDMPGAVAPNPARGGLTM